MLYHYQTLSISVMSVFKFLYKCISSALPNLCFCSTTAIGPDGLCCQSREFKEWHGCRSTKGVTKGVFLKCYDPVTFNMNIYSFIVNHSREVLL